MTDLNVWRLATRWLFGAMIGTALIAVTSPWFVRSYLPTSIDPTRGVAVLPTGADYRWRSEGYATTRIGPLGMPGKSSIVDAAPGQLRVALWGDSQAEGVSVPDNRKLFAQLERCSDDKLQVFPLARSGDDAADWVQQIPSVESDLAIDMHVILIADLPDLLVSDDPPPESTASQRITKLPAFVIQSARNLITDSDSGGFRKLRFSVGPAASSTSQASHQWNPVSNDDWTKSIDRIRDAADKPIWILYAPPSPQIANGSANFNDSAAATFGAIKRIAEDRGVRAINSHAALCQSARAGEWPHGFQNGQIGQGHLNATGYSVVAQVLVAAIESEN